jgi:steroid delta-isomerase-like uncharacterized protein
MSDQNAAIVSRFFEDFANDRNPWVLSEIMAEDATLHDPQAPPIIGREGVGDHIAQYHAAVDAHWHIDELDAAADKVTVVWTATGRHIGELMGLAATGNEISVEGISVFTISDGLITDQRTVWDALGLLQQLGAVPAAA